MKFKLIGSLISASILVLWGSACLAEKALDANNGKNTYVHPQADPSNNNQLWTIKQIDADNFLILSKQTGGALDANGCTGEIYVHPNPNPNNNNQLWRFEKAGIYLMLIPRQCRKALDANNSTGNLYLHPNPDPQNNNQRWRLQPIGDYRLIIPAVGDNLR